MVVLLVMVVMVEEVETMMVERISLPGLFWVGLVCLGWASFWPTR